MKHIVTNSQCGCQVGTDRFGNVVFNYCPKHKAAPDMYEALRVAEKDGTVMKDTRLAVASALAKADGK